MIIRIADLHIEWQDKHADYVKAFSAETPHSPVLTVDFESKLPEHHGIQHFDTASDNVLRSENGEILCANSDWSKATAYFYSPTGGYALPLAAICSRFSYYSAFLMHASCVALNGEGVIFTGNSGVGKTTQAELWQKYLGAEIINGDKAVVREIDGCVYGYGLPWKGSSEYCLNEKAKLKGIVVLRQSKENRITRLSCVQATECFIPHVFMPYWDGKCLDNTLDAFGRVVESVPIFILECRPDEDAVKLTYKTLWKN